MVSIIILVRNRPELTRQTLDSLHASLNGALDEVEVICVDNASAAPTKQVLARYEFHHLLTQKGNTGIGRGKNLGVKTSRGDWLYISDNDIYFFPGWLESLQQTAAAFPEAKILGAFRHPHHGVIQLHKRGKLKFEQSDQQVGSSWFLSKKTWQEFGPLKENLSYGEDDTAFCNRVTKAGYWVGSILPHQVYHCGATNSDGGWSPGGEAYLKKTHPPGILVK